MILKYDLIDSEKKGIVYDLIEAEQYFADKEFSIVKIEKRKDKDNREYTVARAHGYVHIKDSDWIISVKSDKNSETRSYFRVSNESFTNRYRRSQ